MDPGFLDPLGQVIKSRAERQENLEAKVIQQLFSATVGCPRHIKSDKMKMTCNYVNQYLPVQMVVRKFKHKHNLMEVIAGMWGYNKWPARHKEEATALADAHDAFGGEFILVTQYSVPMDPVAYVYWRGGEIRAGSPVMSVPDMFGTGSGLVHIMKYSAMLDWLKEQYSELLPENVLY